ncbi:MAG: hypothetical protein ABR583_14940 [Gaiellaceae bacterium]
MARPADPAPLVLQLSDLPPGYVRGDDSSCGELGIEGASQPLAALIRSTRPQACRAQLERQYGDGAPLVESVAVTFATAGEAAEGFERHRDLLAFLTGSFAAARPVEPAVELGDDTVELVAHDALVEGEARQPPWGWSGGRARRSRP